MHEKIVSILRAERDKIDAAIQALEGSSTTTKRAYHQHRRTMSPEARERISKMMKKRWAERRANGLGKRKAA